MTMLTHRQQQAAARRAVAAFLRHQKAATAALQELTAIGLLENDGNPMTRPLQGEDAVRYFTARGQQDTFLPGDLCDTIDAGKQALDAAGHIV